MEVLHFAKGNRHLGSGGHGELQPHLRLKTIEDGIQIVSIDANRRAVLQFGGRPDHASTRSTAEVAENTDAKRRIGSRA